MAATRLPVNGNHGNICSNIYWPNPQSILDLEYQDGAGGFKIFLAEYIVCVIQYYSDQWINRAAILVLQIPDFLASFLPSDESYEPSSCVEINALAQFSR